MRGRSVSESATHSPGLSFKTRDPTIDIPDIPDIPNIIDGKQDVHNGHSSGDGHRHDAEDSDPPPPPLPPRRKAATVTLDGPDALDTSLSPPGVEPAQSRPTVALQPVDIQTLSFPDGSRGTFSSPALRAVSSATPLRPDTDRDSHQAADSGSARSLAATLRPPADLASLVAGEMNRKSRAWSLLRSQSAHVPPFEENAAMPVLLGADADAAGLADFKAEFDDIPDAAASSSSPQTSDDGYRMLLWKAKMKHFLILSSAGKPIYSRHGDLSLVNGHMGVIRTIISFYEEAKNPLLGFSTGRGTTRFVVSAPNGAPLYLVAISRGLGESDAQLRAQVDALYMQILSTLTLPTLQNIFANRPGSDLRRPLQGTDKLLSSLADSFTRGSASALLGALECLRLRKSHRHAINDAFLRMRTDKLLYGLIVAGGRLVSVIRPRRHSLHPGDLQIIFNMLFESGGIRAGGGESWIPICLPAFNNRGYLYMYVSFFGSEEGKQADNKLERDRGTKSAQLGSESQQQECDESSESRPATDQDSSSAPLADSPAATTTTNNNGIPNDSKDVVVQDEIAIILISPDRESFFELKEMRDKVAEQLARNNGLALIRASVQAGRPRVASVAPGLSLAHFLFKSRANVQFCMSSLDEAALGYSRPAEEAAGGRRSPSNTTTIVSSGGATGISSPSGSSGSSNHVHPQPRAQAQRPLSQPQPQQPPPPTQAQALTQPQLLARRRLMTLYHELQAAAHARHSHLRVLHVARRDACGLAWVTPTFELYCVYGPNASRAAAAAAAEKIVQWAKREEERLFIIGGGVF